MPSRIAFYAPLKPPSHPIPSGDREIARNLIKALRLCGYEVKVATEAISYQKRPSRELFEARRDTCTAERDRLLAEWRAAPETAPNLWFTYHPYCKSPDWIGPAVSKALAIPYVTAEACRTRQATDADWHDARSTVQKAVTSADVNFCLKKSDHDYLATFLPDMSSVVPLKPFIDDQAGDAAAALLFANGEPVLVAVGMMRPGAKMHSYAALADTLRGLPGRWNLLLIGDGPGRSEIETLFAFLAPDRLHLAGAVPHHEVRAWLEAGDIFVLPGIGEAIGMAFLEAQAAGLPVIAFATAGVPEVVGKQSALLAPAGDTGALRDHIETLVADAALRQRMGAAARAHVAANHSIRAAAETIRHSLDPLLAAARNRVSSA